MSEQQKEQPKVKLFRERSLEAVESPEALNDYLRVTSPGVWLVLAAVVLLLAGAMLWGIFGRIHSEKAVAVVVDESGSWCYIPSDSVEAALTHGSVSVGGISYDLDADAGFGMILIPEDASSRLLKAGNLSVGDVAARVAADTDLTLGVYSGTVVTEDLEPISLLLQ